MMQRVSEEWQTKLVACCTDGASVMTGAHKGVVARLRETNKHVLGMHCMAHRLELAFKDAVQKCALARQLEDNLSGLNKFYCKSAQNRANLKRCFSMMGQTPLIPTRVGGTRWVSHLLRAVDQYLRGYNGVTSHLEEVKLSNVGGVKATQQNKTCGYLKTWWDPVALMFCNFMHDCLTQLSSLSKTVQTSDVTVADVHNCLATTQTILTKYKTRSGPKVKAHVDQHESDDNTVNRVMRAKSLLLDKLCQTLQTRFSDMSMSILQATKLVNLKSWPDAENSEEFGESEVEVLMRHFQDVLTSSGIAVDHIPDQWTVLKTHLYETGEFWHKTWPEINRTLKHWCPDMLSLIDLILTLPASTADCERGFSKMKLAKTDWRSRLTTSSLCDLLVVQLSSPYIDDFDPNPAVQLWHQASTRSRQPDFMEGRRSPQDCSSSDSSESDSDED
ncbi:zinc finger protein 862-like [Neoarius graeffei]|uniref:zinc finger protein 862-like n=1 Tax=Neoarius graeffei TaxID=443677 RepID=UPI00298D5B2D|nr:zinc finger protein 862-like [Neoarius graeffei]